MANPTHMYIEHRPETDELVAHFGKASRIYEQHSTTDYTEFMHPTREAIYSFMPVKDPRVEKVGIGSVDSLKKQMIKDAIGKRDNLKVLPHRQIYSDNYFHFVKVDEQHAKSSFPSEHQRLQNGFYARDLGSNLGIFLYGNSTSYNYLGQFPIVFGSLSSLQFHIEDVLTDTKLGDLSGVKAVLVNGLPKKMNEDEELSIRCARDELALFFMDNDIDPITIFSEEKGETVSFAAMQPHNGLVEVITQNLSGIQHRFV